MLSEALKLVPQRWHPDFLQFIKDGEASPEFLAFLGRSRDCRRACEMVLRSDEEMARLIKLAVESK